MVRDSIGDDEAGRRKKERSEVNDQIDWKKLDLGFGGESRPVYDTAGKAVSGLAEKAKEDPLLLAVIQALMAMVGVGKFEDAGSTTPKAAATEDAGSTTPKAAATKTKARALEVKAVRRTDAEDDEHGRAAPARYHHAEKKVLATQRDTVAGAKVQFIERSCPEKSNSFWGKSSPAAGDPAWGKSSGDGVEERGDGATIVDVAEKEGGGVGVHEDADEDVAAVSAEGEDDGSGVNRKRDAAPHEPKAKAYLVRRLKGSERRAVLVLAFATELKSRRRERAAALWCR
ncbi:unnamed protein product [Phytophthora fragariaefolia]|uniref:Unnamed protein product n=1 Tax=Phytophthora fragariaefolia TaxID=1490495 RepID=A0A9W6WUQ6_9STRA|nr:unnamed protein product [Phytophthora fragariaefolia]